jgi:syntaxin 1B/2/3
MQNKIKRQLKVADGSKTDDEIEELARDPEKAQEVL